MKIKSSEKDFDTFKKNVGEFVLSLKNKKHNEIKQYYGFSSYSCNSQFNIFSSSYGNKPAARRTIIDEDGSVTTKNETEHGASINFQYLINGKVHVYLIPASSDSLRVSEDSIILHTIRHIDILNKFKWLFKIYMNI